MNKLEKMRFVDYVILVVHPGNGEGQFPSFHAKCSESVPGERTN